MVQKEEQNTAVAVSDAGTLLSNPAIERMAYFFLRKMQESGEESHSHTFVNSEGTGYDESKKGGGR